MCVCVQGRLLYKVGGRHWRLRHVELTGRLIKCYKVDEEMAPIKDQVILPPRSSVHLCLTLSLSSPYLEPHCARNKFPRRSSGVSVSIADNVLED